MNKFRLFVILLLIGLCCVGALALSAWATAIPARAEVLFGPPSDTLDEITRWRLAWSLVENVDALTLPAAPTGEMQQFELGTGEPATSVISSVTEKSGWCTIPTGQL